MPDLEERVAALEAAVAAPLKAYIPSWEPLTEAQETELREQIAEAAKRGPRVIWQPAPLTSEQVRYLLRECVTVVKPGETLIVRVPLNWHPEQVDRYARDIGEVSEAMDLPFKTVVVAAEELGVAEPETVSDG